MTTDRRVFRLNVKVIVYRYAGADEGAGSHGETYFVTRVDDQTETAEYTAVHPGYVFDKCMDAAYADGKYVPDERVLADALTLFGARWAEELKGNKEKQ